jgi:hypothetical protein
MSTGGRIMRDLVKLRGAVLIIAIILIFPSNSFAFFESLFGSYFKEGIMKSGNFQKDHVSTLATQYNKDIFVFLDQIYATKIKKDVDSYIIERTSSSKSEDPNYYDTTIFKIYCASKNGNIFKWDNRRSSFGGVFYVCEVDKKVDSAQAINIISSKNPVYPYEHKFYYLSNYGFNDYFQRYKDAQSFVDIKGVLSVKPGFFYEDGRVYNISVKLNNNTNSAQEYNFFDIKIINEGKEYTVNHLDKEGKKVKWIEYLPGRFSDKVTFGKIRLNPDQVFKGIMQVEVGGLRIDNLSNISIVTDSIKYSNFRAMTDYDFLKEVDLNP